ncbi:MAG: alpha-2-macroglobulin, partial [Bacteroidota bacterium]
MNLRNVLLAAFFCMVSCLSQAQGKQGSYETKWKVVDSLIHQKGLVQSALTEVNKIYALARQEKNDVQVIRALIYRINLQESTREDATLSSIEDLEKEIALTGQPARSILQNILAGIYWSYFQQHRWQLYNRTATVNFVKKDIATWGAADLHQKMGELYLSSVRDEQLLQQTKLEAYDPILIKGNARALRPTLFDLLSHRALDYFKTDERDAGKPAYAFEIDDTAAFADAVTFAEH